MIKLALKILLILGIAVGASNYLLLLSTGSAPINLETLSLESFKMPTLDSIKRALPGADETVYKWTDDKGVVHYSSSRPDNVQNAQSLTVDPNVNTLPGVRAQPKPKTGSTASGPAPDSASSEPSSVNVEKLIRDAKGVQQLLDDRAKRQDDVINAN